MCVSWTLSQGGEAADELNQCHPGLTHSVESDCHLGVALAETEVY